MIDDEDITEPSDSVQPEKPPTTVFRQASGSTLSLTHLHKSSCISEYSYQYVHIEYDDIQDIAGVVLAKLGLCLFRGDAEHLSDSDWPGTNRFADGLDGWIRQGIF